MAVTRLPDAELEVMKVIWKNGGETTSSQITEKLEGKKDWAVTTILNFLIRLVNRGFLTVRKNGKTNIYTPAVSEKEYLENESKSFLEKLYDNSLQNLVASLYNGKSISATDLEELKRYIDEKAGEANGGS